MRTQAPGGIALEAAGADGGGGGGGGDSGVSSDGNDDTPMTASVGDPYATIERFHDKNVAQDILDEARENYKKSKSMNEVVSKITGTPEAPVITADKVDKEHERDAMVTGLKQKDGKGTPSAAAPAAVDGKTLIGDLEKHKVRAHAPTHLFSTPWPHQSRQCMQHVPARSAAFCA